MTHQAKECCEWNEAVEAAAKLIANGWHIQHPMKPAGVSIGFVPGDSGRADAIRSLKRAPSHQAGQEGEMDAAREAMERLTGDAPSHQAGQEGEHTPTPWRVCERSLWIVADNVPKGPMHVADVRGWGYLTGKGHGALGLPDKEALEIQKANADFIVRAVNAYEYSATRIETLKEVLRKIETELLPAKHTNDLTACGKRILEIARAAGGG